MKKNRGGRNKAIRELVLAIDELVNARINYDRNPFANNAAIAERAKLQLTVEIASLLERVSDETERETIERFERATLAGLPG